MPATDLTALIGDRTSVVLTGAGISTDSGIPDYRGPDSPVRLPMTFQDFVSGPRMQQRYWARAHIGWQRMSAARPNEGHVALVRLQEAGRLSGLITQNVDGLHDLAGHRDVIDLHGRIDRVICLECHEVTARDTLHQRLSRLNAGHAEGFVVATCEACGGVLKPDVVFFGENVPKSRVARCIDLVDSAESLVVLGSSLQVMSGLRFVRQARKRGLPIAIVNRGRTRGDDLADLKLDSGVSEVLRAYRVDRNDHLAGEYSSHE